ncbi:MAG: nicotinate-nucleotide--dimethylbenzimidazole phosphoribosyltransferase [Nitrospirales bacterium]|nr:MAG: nicotinate-nucleotide--dimethylbenzimidazole phosphoribosyltransferase [Nitrospirales bacterium]
MSHSSPFIQEILAAIQLVSDAGVRRAQLSWDRLTKPQGSLGRLESLGTQYVSITQSLPVKNPEAMVFVLAADHGVAREGVSAYPSSVTAQMVKNFLQGGAAINVLARQIGARVRIVDMGVQEDMGASSGLWVRKIGLGTGNFCEGPAMSREQAVQSVEDGIRLVQEAHADGIRLIGVGEMGIGNTTVSSAITAVMTRRSVADVTGKGTGVDALQLAKKIQVIERGIQRNIPDAHDPLDVLAKVGGFEIGGLVGILVGAAACRVPVVLDGFITGVAALLAVALEPHCHAYMIPSHVSAEPGHRVAMDALGFHPLLDLDLRLGEGTGACLAIGLLQSSLACLTQMATFESAGVDEAVRPFPEMA